MIIDIVRTFNADIVQKVGQIIADAPKDIMEDVFAELLDEQTPAFVITFLIKLFLRANMQPNNTDKLILDKLSVDDLTNHELAHYEIALHILRHPEWRGQSADDSLASLLKTFHGASDEVREEFRLSRPWGAIIHLIDAEEVDPEITVEQLKEEMIRYVCLCSSNILLENVLSRFVQQQLHYRSDLMDRTTFLNEAIKAAKTIKFTSLGFDVLHEIFSYLRPEYCTGLFVYDGKTETLMYHLLSILGSNLKLLGYLHSCNLHPGNSRELFSSNNLMTLLLEKPELTRKPRRQEMKELLARMVYLVDSSNSSNSLSYERFIPRNFEMLAIYLGRGI